MSEAVWHTGDALTVLRTLETDSVDLVLTSPPFLALRSYLPADHPDKDREMGSEATPGAYVDALMEVVEECRRVLTPHGSICLELGDTFSGSGGAGGDYNDKGLREGQPRFRQQQPNMAWRLNDDGSVKTDSARRASELHNQPHVVPEHAGPGWPLAKSLTLVPEIVRFTMVYGFNPLTGRETEPWRLRNVIRWVRPNPPVGALGDKFRPATTEMLVACVSKDRYFDLDAVRKPYEHPNHSQLGKLAKGGTKDQTKAGNWDTYPARTEHPAGAPPLDWWQIPTAPYKGAHYATFPPALCVKPILAMCPQRVCRVCGKPSQRITEQTEEYAAFRAAKNAGEHGQTD